MTKSIIKQFIFLLIAVLFFSIYKAPVDIIFSFIDVPKNVKFYEAEGSVWNGSFKRIAIDKKWVDNLSWTFTPYSFILSDGASVNIHDSELGNATFNLGFRKVFTETVVSNFNYKSNLLSITKRLKLKLSPIEYVNGIINSNIEKIIINEDGYLSDINGSIIIKNAEFKQSMLSRSNIDVGEIKLKINGDYKNLVISINQNGSMFNFSGNMDINSMSKYTLTGIIYFTDKTPPMLKNSLTMVGKKNEDGSIFIEFENYL
ncbi:MAG: type II secretion system protein N [Succinivibrionaceae bacterium]